MKYYIVSQDTINYYIAEKKQTLFSDGICFIYSINNASDLYLFKKCFGRAEKAKHIVFIKNFQYILDNIKVFSFSNIFIYFELLKTFRNKRMSKSKNIISKVNCDDINLCLYIKYSEITKYKVNINTFAKYISENNLYVSIFDDTNYFCKLEINKNFLDYVNKLFQKFKEENYNKFYSPIWRINEFENKNSIITDRELACSWFLEEKSFITIGEKSIKEYVFMYGYDPFITFNRHKN